MSFRPSPKGALLFIREEISASTPGKFRDDGIGDITHMGVKTGRGVGAIHSSHSRGCVCTSKFKDRTIPNGGWNRVGLLPKIFDYGKTIGWVLEHSGSGQVQPENTEGEKHMTATVTSLNGGPVNLRKAAGRSAALVDRILPGTETELLESGSGWSRIRVNGRTGWMMTEFLTSDESVPAQESAGGTYSVTISGLDRTQAQAFQIRYPDCVIEKEVG